MTTHEDDATPSWLEVQQVQQQAHDDVLVAAMDADHAGGWKLSNIAFMCKGQVGTLICDTGTEVTCVSLDFVRRCGAVVRPLAERVRYVRLPDGVRRVIVGTTELEVSVQLMVKDHGVWVHWDRMVELRHVRVVDFGAPASRDLYVAWPDFAFTTEVVPTKPLAQLAHMVATGGAEVVDARRVEEASAAPKVGAEAVVAAMEVDVAAMRDTDIRGLLLAGIEDAQRATPEAAQLIAGLMARREVFTEMDVKKCTEIVDFEVVKEPDVVSFRVPTSRRVPLTKVQEVMDKWVTRGVVEKVPHDTPSYGFAMSVTKPGSDKVRLVIDARGLNNATAEVQPAGGFMPTSLVQEAVSAAQGNFAVSMDLSEAFTTLKLGPTARRLSVFTTPVGKYRWKMGYFGWSGFPAKFMTVIMEKVILVLRDEFGNSVTICWVDDVVISAPTLSELVRATLRFVDLVLAIGGRLSLAKCKWLVTEVVWCGVQLNLRNHEYRVDPSRVENLLAFKSPIHREQLGHLLGVLRYYWWCVHDHNMQRDHIMKLQELDVDGVRVADRWTPDHETALKLACEAVAGGKWILAFDPRQPVYVTTDAAGSHGYCVTAHQWDKVSGKMRPISFHSQAWHGPQLLWTAQTKEQYAARQAVAVVMPKAFPYAKVILLCDNKNLSYRVESEDVRVRRWALDIACSGAIVRQWLPGKWNTVADYGSRVMHAEPETALTQSEEYDMHIYAMVSDAAADGETLRVKAAADDVGTVAVGEGLTVVPGHLPAAPLALKIADVQAVTDASERARWHGVNYSTVMVNGKPLVVYKGRRAVVPRDATSIKHLCMRMCHDDQNHIAGVGRMLVALRAMVHWEDMDAEVTKYVGSCVRCQFAKAKSHAPAKVGTLTPTVAPYVHHTWYVDLKGPLPHHTGYILVVVEAFTRFVRLRYLASNKWHVFQEEMEDVVASFGTTPVVIRSDNGPPMNSDEWSAWLRHHRITPAPGVPHHSQGQGVVETRIRTIAEAIMATLGHKAPEQWNRGMLLTNLELYMNSTYCESTTGSPYWAMYGMEPRTPLRADLDWTTESFGEDAVGAASVTYDEVTNLLAEHHARLDAVQQRVQFATTLAQAITKKAWDSKRKPGDYKIGDMVLVHRTAPNRMLPHFTGPMQVTAVSTDGNMVTVKHFLDDVEDDTVDASQVHVSRLLHFDASRTSKAELTAFQLGDGVAVVQEVLEHRRTADGGTEFHIRWYGIDVTSWEPSKALKNVVVVKEYCATHGLLPPGSDVKKRTTKERPARAKRRAATAAEAALEMDTLSSAPTSGTEAAGGAGGSASGDDASGAPGEGALKRPRRATATESTHYPTTTTTTTDTSGTRSTSAAARPKPRGVRAGKKSRGRKGSRT